MIIKFPESITALKEPVLPVSIAAPTVKQMAIGAAVMEYCLV